ncbi:MAG: pyrroline-5-carboxylate reductase [Deltaproteobacteria bacterium]|nr:MAG: pyrroline-5-carboxylate reductase [Deltaproteobacteria bacterium]
MSKGKIGFIGCGNMGTAIVQSLIQKKIFTAKQIGISEADAKKRSQLKKKLKVATFTDNKNLVSSSEIILLAVKPQQMKEVLKEISPYLTKQHLILSIAAGLDTAFFTQHLPPKTRLIRVMPNMGVMIGMGASGLFASITAKPQDKKIALKIFTAGGQALFVPREELLDSVTAVSGSGPAFVFLFIESLIQAGIQDGLTPSVSRQLVLQTLKGATEMATLSRESLSDLIQKSLLKVGPQKPGLKH